MIFKILQLGSATTGMLTTRLLEAGGRKRSRPLAAYPVLEASLVRAELSGTLAAETRRLRAAGMARP